VTSKTITEHKHSGREEKKNKT